jgi:hypothetical protein
MLGVAQVVRQFALQGALDQGFGQLLEQAIRAEQVIGRLVVLQKLIE